MSKTAELKARKAQIQKLLESNDRAVMRAVIVIHARQTAYEQSAQQTTEMNGVGFSGLDAEILSSFAERLKGTGNEWNVKFGPRALTDKQLAIARRRMLKYWKQLVDAADEKAAINCRAAAYRAASNGE